MRLIDADALITLLQDVLSRRYGENESPAYIAFERFIEMLRASPTIEAEPVRHGEWLPYPSDQYRKCSVCGIEHLRYEMILKHKFCPNCGAKMDGKEQ